MLHVTKMLHITKKWIVKTLIWSVAMYACETWTLRKEEVDRVNALEMWIWRQMERIIWSEKKTNEQVLSPVREERHLLENVVKRKKTWVGDIVRGQELMKHVME